YGISGSKEARNRSTIDWNYQGRSLLLPHYQRLAWIRGSFSAFSTQAFTRLTTNSSLVYGFVRPLADQNGISLINFSSAPTNVSVSLVGTGGSANVLLTGGAQDGKTYYMNDVYNDTSVAVTFNAGVLNFTTTIAGYGSAVYVLSDSVKKLVVPLMTSVKGHLGELPTTFKLYQNYPNPFNPSTTLTYDVAERAHVELKVYNILGMEVATLVDGAHFAGTYTVRWDGKDYHGQIVSSGVYFVRFQAGGTPAMKKIVFLK
ncbi:MAG: Por secretion system C-terminal sorting domain-containing protein, partial [Bacteroidetes bacterium]|nr:Por secretion system C-terminal sorting domain-containing protein [Bacteroidota bacterium]